MSQLLQVVWFYNKTTRLSTSDRLSLEERKEGGQTLTLHKLSYNDFGLYTCRWYTSYHVARVKERVVTISETHLLITFFTPKKLQTFISYEQLHLQMRAVTKLVFKRHLGLAWRIILWGNAKWRCSLQSLHMQSLFANAREPASKWWLEKCFGLELLARCSLFARRGHWKYSVKSWYIRVLFI